MKTKTSMLKLAKNIGSVGLLFTLQQQDAVNAAQTGLTAHTDAQIDAEISSMSATVQQALSKVGEGSEALSQSQIQNMIHSSIESLVSEQQQVDQTQKTNLEESNAAEHKSHHKKHHKNKHHHEDAAIQTHTSAPKFISQVPKSPAAANLVKVDNAASTSHPTLVDVPIDEVQAIELQVNTLYNLDTIESVTLKSFRKVVGYDTFNSILNGQRDETKDMSDHYNITMTVMVKRDPESAYTPPAADVFDGGKTLSKIIDKGFPYDDGDNSIEDQTPKWSKKKTETPINVGKLNGENVTKQALVALVKDTDAPITQGLVQLDEMKSDADGLFKLMDANVTRGNLKNLVTDKPSPITVGLAQKSDADGLFKLMDANVTRGNLKNLVTDKPSPITVGLAQKSDADGLFKLMDANVTRGNLKNLITDKPSPITVGLAQKSDADGLFKLMDANVTRGNLKNLITDKPSPITVGLAQKSDADGLFKLMDANVTRGNLKNLVTDKPSPITVGLAQKSDADGLFKLMDANVTRGNLKNLVTDKPSPITVGLAQINNNGNITTLSQGVPVGVNPVIAKDTMGDAKLDMKILVGPDDVELKKKEAKK